MPLTGQHLSAGHTVLTPTPTPHACRVLPCSQVDVAVVTKSVTVLHAPALTCPATLVAALNDAQLEASLTFPRQQVQVGAALGAVVLAFGHKPALCAPAAASLSHFSGRLEMLCKLSSSWPGQLNSASRGTLVREST